MVETHFILLMHPDSKACQEVEISEDIPRLSVAHPLAKLLFPQVATIPTIIEFAIIPPEELQSRIQPSFSSLEPPPAEVVPLVDDKYKLKVKNASDLAREMEKERDETLIPDPVQKTYLPPQATLTRGS